MHLAHSLYPGVVANAVFSLLLVLAINNFIHVGHYPVHRHLPHLLPAAPSGELTINDIEWAPGKMEGAIDADKKDLLEIFRLDTEHVHKK
jgi:hypothetical protein